MNASQDCLELAGIRVSDKAISERDSNGKPLAWVAREEIVRASLRTGSESKNPAFQSAFGLLLAAIALWPIAKVVEWMLYGGKISIFYALMSSLFALGGYLICSASIRKPILQIEKIRGTQKLAFRGKLNADELRNFVSEARSKFACEISFDLVADVHVVRQ